jgi:hypothetical protein
MPPASQAGAMQRYLTVKRDGDDMSHTIGWREFRGLRLMESLDEEAGEWYIRNNLLLDKWDIITTSSSFTIQYRHQ